MTNAATVSLIDVYRNVARTARADILFDQSSKSYIVEMFHVVDPENDLLSFIKRNPHFTTIEDARQRADAWFDEYADWYEENAKFFIDEEI
jgi:hypothetical protein